MTPAGVFAEYRLPVTEVGAIAAAPDGRVWFTDQGLPEGDKWGPHVGFITTEGAVTSFPRLDVQHWSQHMTIGGDRNAWFTSQTPQAVGRITPTGQLTWFNLPTLGSQGHAEEITTAPDGSVWFIAYRQAGENAETNLELGHISTDGQVTLTPTPLTGLNATPIAATSDGTIWFATQRSATVIGKRTPGGALTIRNANVNIVPHFMTAGPDGNLWITEDGPTRAVSRMTPAGVFTKFTHGLTASPEPLAGITAAPDGNLWFADPGGRIGRITTAGAITEFPRR
jgi:virginiamycin B lyase